MKQGLLVKDASGRVLLDPDTFTVRLVTSLYFPAGSYRGTVRLNCPQARTGMFAVGVSDQPWSGDGRSIGFYDTNPRPWTTTVNSALSRARRMAAFRVGEGYIEAFSPSPGVLFHGGQYVYLFTDV